MNENFTDAVDEAASQFDLNWQKRLDAVALGQCSEDEFMDEISTLRETRSDSAWNVVALLDQRYRRGKMPVDLFRSLESKIARGELSAPRPGPAIDVITQHLNPQSDAAMFTVPDGGPHESPSQFGASIGRVLRDRYVIDSRLGSGGMGKVYKAVDRFRTEHAEIGCHVAVKILHEDTRRQPQALAKLRREFYCAQALSHRSVVKVFELDRDDDLDFFTMELLDGELLSGAIQRWHPLAIPRSFAWSIIREVGAGLVHAHSRNVVHADLKPQNIMLTKSGEVRVLDFGASIDSARARPAAGSSSNNSTAVTPAYASCELLEGQQPDARDDLYALACLSYELLTGQHPFQHRRSTEARKLGMTPRRPSGLARRQWKAVELGLSWEREGRSLPVREWLAELNPGNAPLGQISGPPDSMSEPSSRERASTRLVAALVTLLVCIMAWAALSVSRWQDEVGSVHAESLPAPGVRVSADVAAPIVAPLPVAALAVIAPPVVPVPAQKSRAVHALSGAALADRAYKIGIAAQSYRIRPGKNFAEIRVRRTLGAVGDTSFTWWTEPASALAGVDYVQQDRTTAAFLPGRRVASLFIKLLPNASRRQSNVFFVVIDNPSKGSSISRSKAAISLSQSG